MRTVCNTECSAPNVPWFITRFPDHRWHCAEWAYRTRRKIDEHDQTTQDALEYIKWQNKKNKSIIPPCLWYACVEKVQELFEPEKQRLRWLLQAYLWTDLSLEEIAKATGLGVGIVETFRDLHYDVASLKKAADARMSFLLRDRTPDQIPADDEEFYLAFYAIHGGPLVLEAVRDYYDHRQEFLQPLQGLDIGKGQRTVELLLIHAAILARSLRAQEQPTVHLQELLYLVGLLDQAMNLNVNLLQPLRSSLENLSRISTSGPNSLGAQIKTLLGGLGA